MSRLYSGCNYTPYYNAWYTYPPLHEKERIPALRAYRKEMMASSEITPAKDMDGANDTPPFVLVLPPDAGDPVFPGDSVPLKILTRSSGATSGGMFAMVWVRTLTRSLADLVASVCESICTNGVPFVVPPVPKSNLQQWKQSGWAG